MPEATDWHALDARIAREVMGYLSWDDLPAKARDAILDHENAQWRCALEEMHRMMWWEACEEWPHGFWWVSADLRLEDWQPHKNVAQAMLALRTLLAKIGSNATAKIAMRPLADLYRVTIQNWVATGGVPAMLVRSPHVDNEMHAICLAIEACLNHQGMPDWAAS